jgi:hypothetical protein
MLRNKSIFQISTLICLSSISICNLLIDLPSYYYHKLLDLTNNNSLDIPLFLAKADSVTLTDDIIITIETL